MQWFKVPAKIYSERDSIQYLQDMKDCEKVMNCDRPFDGRFGLRR